MTECPEILTVRDCIDIGRLDIALRILNGSGSPVPLNLSDEEKQDVRQCWATYHPSNREDPL